VVVPVVGSPWAPVADHRYLSGLKRWRDRWIHVSTGVGSAGGIRLNCRPEVTALDLLAPEPGLPG
jgi:predicted MPP superfamily phosphohydrolase